MMNSLVVSLALALSGEIQPGLGEVPGMPNYAPIGAHADRGQLWNLPANGGPTGPERRAARGVSRRSARAGAGSWHGGTSASVAASAGSQQRAARLAAHRHLGRLLAG